MVARYTCTLPVLEHSSFLVSTINIKALLFFQQFYCNLGWDLLASDVNDDGFDDVIVGSPFAAASGEQRGFVAALFADERLGMSRKACDMH